MRGQLPSDKCAQIAYRREKKLLKPNFPKTRIPNKTELAENNHEQEIWFELKQRERVMQELNRLRFCCQELVDHLELFVPLTKIPEKDRYLHLIRACKGAMGRK